jgi:hypothetical protein
MCNPGGFVALPPKWDWCQIRRVGFHEEPIFRNEPEKLVVSPLLERHDAAEGDVPAGVDRERGEAMSPSVAVQYASDTGRARVSNDCARVVLGVPGVHDHGSAGLRGERHLCGERVALGLAGRVVVVVVETTLADSDSTPGQKLPQPGDVPARIETRGVVRMDAGRSENESRVLGRARSGDRRGIDRFTDADDRQSARLAGAGDYLAAVAGERRVREVGVAVDED